MCMLSHSPIREVWRGAIACVVAGTMLPALAEVRVTSETHSYRVPGSTAKSVAPYMLRHPYAGDHGGAFANIRPHYSLSVSTKQVGDICRADDIDLKIHFVVTLPEAVDLHRMSGKTRAAWNGFTAFARRHEAWHQASYVNCAKAFVAAAKRQKADACYAVSANVRKMFRQAKRDCEVKQLAFDRQQARVVPGLTLFNMAGY